MLNISTIFAHCEHDTEPLRVRVEVKPGDTSYLEIESVIGIFISREKLRQLADAIYAAIAPSVDLAQSDTQLPAEVSPEQETPFDDERTEFGAGSGKIAMREQSAIESAERGE